MTVVFLQGFSGDVTQVDNLDPHVNPGAEAWARLVGGRVGAEAVKVLLGAVPGSEALVDARARAWRIPRRMPTAEHVRRAANRGPTATCRRNSSNAAGALPFYPL